MADTRQEPRGAGLCVIELGQTHAVVDRNQDEIAAVGGGDYFFDIFVGAVNQLCGQSVLYEADVLYVGGLSAFDINGFLPSFVSRPADFQLIRAGGAVGQTNGDFFGNQDIVQIDRGVFWFHIYADDAGFNDFFRLPVKTIAHGIEDERGSSDDKNHNQENKKTAAERFF